jgi:hypothetical protein
VVFQVSLCLPIHYLEVIFDIRVHVFDRLQDTLNADD